MEFPLLFLNRNFECPARNEVLISVSTEPTDGIHPRSPDIPEGSTTATRICFICNTASSESYVDFYEGTKSEHSRTPLRSFVWKFLDNKASVRDCTESNSRLLCAKCVDKINEYDFACVKSARLEEELLRDLTRTEATYSQTETGAQNSSNMNGSDDDELPSEVQTSTELAEMNDSSDSILFTVELSEDEEADGIVIIDDVDGYS